jgi:hypothetical protein
MTTSPVPGFRVSSVSSTCCATYVEVASSTSAGSVRLMSPGVATTSVPPSFGVPAADVAGAVDGDGAGDGAVDAAGVAGAGVGDAAPPQAATRTAAPALVRDSDAHLRTMGRRPC